MKVGDLVRVETHSFSRVGLIIDKAAMKNCFVVQFWDGERPTRCAYNLRIIRRLT